MFVSVFSVSYHHSKEKYETMFGNTVSVKKTSEDDVFLKMTAKFWPRKPIT
jgi:hypothetical protein